ncbi:hypothetical protein EQG49_01825 [Periweissella cryptocerci]|uniref:Uncharacterized protein n=1 Tax=Periweissella cryptocerci TaxID=2506420 RepID=A0A4P6YRK9_9LACO|nr:hypothetical protein [Periweissella cryptocerci]QBO35288.1 hypothetical protein EQG49_01825 [Periweissella cryptocerci]
MQNSNDIISPIKSIEIFTTDAIVGLTINYENNQIEHFGVETPSSSIMLLEAGTYLESITVWQQSHNNEVPTMTGLALTSSDGTQIMRGTQVGKFSTYEQPNHIISRLAAEYVDTALANLSMITYQPLVAITARASEKLALVI